MSNSYKKILILGNAYAKSEKQDKRLANRRYRRACKNFICKNEYDIKTFPDIQECSNSACMSKDGKRYFYLMKSPEENLYCRFAISLKFYRKHIRK